MLIAAGQLPPSQAEVRFSSRRQSKKVTNYNEEEEDDFEEDEEDENMTPNYGWATTVEDTGPVIDKVLDHRPKEGIGELAVRAEYTQTNLYRSRDADTRQGRL
jgi:chromodomain-helicase-DNA-binding protein 1